MVNNPYIARYTLIQFGLKYMAIEPKMYHVCKEKKDS